MATILFIEDEPALQKALGDYLRDQGYSVVQALDGPSGLETAERERPDLILLDLVLPRLPGLEVLEALGRDQRLQTIPVIVLTNVESNESVERSLELGAKAYLIKTNYTLSDLGSKIASVLKDQSRRGTVKPRG